MNSKCGTHGLTTYALGPASIDWMLVIPIAAGLIYRAILTYHASIEEFATSMRFSRVFGIMAGCVGGSAEHADMQTDLRGGQCAHTKFLKHDSLKQLQRQATDIAQAAVDIRHGNDTCSQRGASFEPEFSLHRQAAPIKPLIKTRFPQRNPIPDWVETARCNRGIVS